MRTGSTLRDETAAAPLCPGNGRGKADAQEETIAGPAEMPAMKNAPVIMAAFRVCRKREKVEVMKTAALKSASSARLFGRMNPAGVCCQELATGIQKSWVPN